jgi:hypothetical protein
MLRLFSDGRLLGNAEVSYDERFVSFDFHSPALSRHLDTLILPDLRRAAGDSAGHFNSIALVSAGYELRVDESLYILHVTAPPESKALRRTCLSGSFRAAPQGRRIDPALFSFYMNYGVDQRVRRTLYGYAPEYTGSRRVADTLVRDPATVNLDGAFIVSGWVLEGSALVSEPRGGHPFDWSYVRRGDVRLVRDFVPRQVRFAAGEVGVGADLVPLSEAVFGARYEYNPWFFGNDPRRERNSVTFFMPRPGTVELYLDGRFQQRFALPAGHHRISGFDGEVGRNRAVLMVRTADGAVEELPFEFVLSDPRNMQVGESRYTLSAGFRRVWAQAPVQWTPDFEEPLAGADYLYGLRHYVSAGLGGYVSRHNVLTAAQALVNTRDMGWLELRGYISNARFEEPGARTELNYTLHLERSIRRLNMLLTGNADGGPLPNMSVAARGHWQSRFYNTNPFVAVVGENAQVGGVSGNVGFGVFRGNISADGALVLNREVESAAPRPSTEYRYGVRVAQNFPWLSFVVSAGENVAGDVRTPYFSLTGGLNYSKRFRFRNHQFNAHTRLNTRSVRVPPMLREVEVEEGEEPRYEEVPARYEYLWSGGADLGWRYATSGSGVGAQSYAVNASVRDDNLEFPSVNATVRHTYNRADLMLNYGYSGSEGAFHTTETHTARVRLAGSFMFADGLWAFGRPTNGNFVLVDTRGSLDGAKVHVNRMHHFRRDLSRSGWLGAAYHNRISEYQPAGVTVTLTDVPLGGVLDGNRYHAWGAYRRGHALRLGDRTKSVIAQVRFMDGDQPLRHVYLTIEPEEGGAGARRSAFTNSGGVLQAGGLVPGAVYTVRFGTGTFLKDAEITIPRDADLIAELPDIAVERE